MSLRHARHAQQPGLLVEQRLDRARRPSSVRPSGRASRRDRASPQRVPIGSPSSAVKPIVLATLRPPSSAHMLAPLPRCGTTVCPRGRAASCCGSTRGDVLVRQAVEAVAPHASLGRIRRGSANSCATRRLAAVECGVEAGDLRQVRGALEHDAGSAPGCAAGAAARAGPASRAPRARRRRRGAGAA